MIKQLRVLIKEELSKYGDISIGDEVEIHHAYSHGYSAEKQPRSSGPGSLSTAGTLHKGEKFIVDTITNDYAKVTLSSGQPGWVHKNVLKRIDSDEAIDSEKQSVAKKDFGKVLKKYPFLKGKITKEDFINEYMGQISTNNGRGEYAGDFMTAVIKILASKI